LRNTNTAGASPPLRAILGNDDGTENTNIVLFQKENADENRF
jgi:hypothetical protein